MYLGSRSHSLHRSNTMRTRITSLRGNIVSRACRATAVRQEEQLRAWLHEMRAERRRLEDRLLQGSSRALQDTRADLESAVFALQGRLATAETEATTVGAAASAQARAQV